MEPAINENFPQQSSEVLRKYKEILGFVFVYNGKTAPTWVSVVVLLVTGVVFYLLAVLVLTQKQNEI